MKSISFILAGLFVAQLAVAGALYFNTWSQRAVRPQGSLLALDTNEVDLISIDGEGESITLEKKQDAWVIASSGLPAAASQVESTIQSIGDMQLGWAVASSDASHQQLEVADDKYQRHIKIGSGGNTVGDIFVGTSPGFKRSHVRKEGADEVYSVAINAYDLPPDSIDWLDKSLLQVADVTSVMINDKALVKKDDQWLYDGSDNTDQDKAADLVKELEGIRVTDIFDDSSDEPDFEKVLLKAGDKEYEFGFASKDSDYLVSRKDIDWVFRITKSSYEKVMAVELILPEPETQSELKTEAEPKADAGSEANPASNTTVTGSSVAKETQQPASGGSDDSGVVSGGAVTE